MMIRNGAVVAIYKSHLQSEAAIGKCNNICNKNESKEQHYENDPLAPAFGSDELGIRHQHITEGFRHGRPN